MYYHCITIVECATVKIIFYHPYCLKLKTPTLLQKNDMQLVFRKATQMV